jgi:hypothetical protein
MDPTKSEVGNPDEAGRASTRAPNSLLLKTSQGSRGRLPSHTAILRTCAKVSVPAIDHQPRIPPVKRLLRGLAVTGVMLFLSCKPTETKVLLGPSEALGTVLAQEAARVAGARKQVAIISPDINWGAVSTAEEAFRNALKKEGFTVVVAKAANLGDPMRRGPVGLAAADFHEALEKSADAGAIVSFAGAPLLKPGDAARVPAGHPPILVVATASLGNVQGVWGDAAQLGRMLDSKAIDLAIVDGADPAAPVAGKADAAHALFGQNYRILRRAN